MTKEDKFFRVFTPKTTSPTIGGPTKIRISENERFDYDIDGESLSPTNQIYKLNTLFPSIFYPIYVYKPSPKLILYMKMVGFKLDEDEDVADCITYVKKIKKEKI